MIEVFDNLWTYIEKNPVDFICVTTNGYIKSDGSLVMGRGIAREVKSLFPGIEHTLGDRVRKSGNCVHVFYNVERPTGRKKKFYNLVSFPTKHEDWRENSDLDLIRLSALELEEIAKTLPTRTFLLPRPGCGNGGLDWKDVKPVIDFLPNNVFIISR